MCDLEALRLQSRGFVVSGVRSICTSCHRFAFDKRPPQAFGDARDLGHLGWLQAQLSGERDLAQTAASGNQIAVDFSSGAPTSGGGVQTSPALPSRSGRVRRLSTMM